MEKKIKKSEPVRLNVHIQEHGLASRRKADELIKAGLVKVNGKVVTELGTKVEKSDEVIVDGKKLARKPHRATYLFHKPYLTLTSRSDDRSRPTIFDLTPLKKIPGNIQPVGRLDFKSEGLLILTNDGDLALTLSHPKYAVEKTYSVLISTQITTEEIEQLKKGIQLEDGPAKPLHIKLLNREKLANSMGQWLEISVNEGRNRLVRRMLESLGLKVVRLMRVAIGKIRLPSNLLPGKIRPLTEHEKNYLNELKNRLQENHVPVKKKTQVPAKTTKTKSHENYAKKVTVRQKKLQSLARSRQTKGEK